MLKSLQSWLTATPTAKVATNPNPRRFAPQVEALQDRLTPSVNVIGGHLIIHGATSNDTVIVTQSGSNYRVWVDTNGYLVPPKVTEVPVASVTGDMVFKGFDGNDSFTHFTGLRTTAYGGNGNDTLVGGSGADTMYGDAGDDKLMGMGGSDVLYGGGGNDRLYSAGDHTNNVVDLSSNYLYGETGNDSLFGSGGNDILVGSSGNDLLSGNGGNDDLRGESGSDTLYGGDGNDRLDGGVGDGSHDHLVGGAGADVFMEDFDNDGRNLQWNIMAGLFPLNSNFDEPSDFVHGVDILYRN